MCDFIFFLDFSMKGYSSLTPAISTFWEYRQKKNEERQKYSLGRKLTENKNFMKRSGMKKVQHIRDMQNNC